MSKLGTDLAGAPSKPSRILDKKVDPQVFTSEITGKTYTSVDADLARNRNMTVGKRTLDEAIYYQMDKPNAFYRPDIGQIDLIWGVPGNPKNKFAGGSGLAHIIAKRDWEKAKGIINISGEEFAKSIPEIIANGNTELSIKVNHDPRYEFHLDGKTYHLNN